MGTADLSEERGAPARYAPGLPTESSRLHRRQPVGCVNTASPGYHYTKDHLLPLEPPGSAGNQPRRRPASSPSHQRSCDPTSLIVAPAARRVKNAPEEITFCEAPAVRAGRAGRAA